MTTQRLALCVGINDYPGTGNDLAGCVNDADDWDLELRQRGFTTVKLLDAEATRDRMLQGFKRVLDAAMFGDIAVITYSGHGTWVPDLDGDELDRRDEALCPHDITTMGPITDDDLYDLFSRRRYGVRVVFISDSCHSGTLQRFAPPLAPVHVPHPDDPSVAQDQTRRVRFLPPAAWMDDDHALRALAETAAGAPIRGTMRRTAAVLAGCRDSEYCYDAWFDGRANGAYTRAALHALQRLPAGATYRDWQREIRALLPSVDYPQTPQLDASRWQRGWPVLVPSAR